MIENFAKWIAVLSVLCCFRIVRAQTITITDRGVRNIETTTVDQHGKGFTIAGLSGIARLSADEFLAVMDNSDKLVRFAIHFNQDASLESIKCTGGITLADVRDFEGIALSPGKRDAVMLSEEDTPAIHEYRLSDGAHLQTLTTPRVFLAPNLRPNFGFESLAARDDVLWTANEEALKCDGDRSDAKSGCAVRLLKYTRRDQTFAPAGQFIYLTDPIHKPYSDIDRHMSRSGVSELLLLPDGRLLALERSFSKLGPMDAMSDFRNSIYEIEFSGATDVSGPEFERGMIGKRFNPVRKKLLWSHRGNEIGNLEGIALGPQLALDRWAAVGLIDNNGIKLLTNRVVSFEIRITPSAENGRQARERAR